MHIVNCDVDVLRNELQVVNEKVKHTEKEVLETYKKNSDKTELKKAELLYSKLKETIGFQSNEITRLNHILQNVESQILDQQSSFNLQKTD
jgi:hypothetical protein